MDYEYSSWTWDGKDGECDNCKMTLDEGIEVYENLDTGEICCSVECLDQLEGEE